MARTKTPSVAARSFVPSAEHQISLGEAHQLASTLTVYGKLIADVTITPSDAGTVHPQAKDESLQLALVFGISDNGQCITLPQPQKVYLPAPDGPADGCGWDPDQYLVWKNLPRDWNTIHVQTKATPLAMALKPMMSPALAPQPYLEDVLNDQWLKTSTHIDINHGDTLGALWGQYGAGDYNSRAVQRLIQAIQTAYCVSLPASSLPASLTFSQLQILVGHA
jgi:hypothetical protein